MEYKKTRTLTLLLQVISSLIITAVLFIILFSYISGEETLKAVSKINFLLIVFSVAMLLLIYFFRSLQLYIFFSKKIPVSFLYLITTIHTFFVQVIPFRLGELSFIYLIGKTKKVTSMDTIVVLGSARVFDISIVSIFFVISLLCMKKIPPALSSPWLYIPLLGALLMIIIFFFFVNHIFSFIHQRAHFFSQTWILKAIEKLESILLFLQTFQHKKTIFKLFILSIFIWVTYYCMLIILYRSMGILLPLETFIFIISSVNLFAIIPLQGIAGLGNVEFSWVFLLGLFGIDNLFALKTAFIVHIISLIGVVSVGVIGILIWIYIGISQNQKIF